MAATYSEITVDGSSRVHLGDVHNQHTVNVTGNTFIWHGGATSSQTIFDWFSPITYWLHHQQMCTDLYMNSGRWLLEKQEYYDWKNSERSSVLWLHGIPGSGKSKLVAHVINDLKPSLGQSDLSGHFAYFYCLRDTVQEERSRALHVIRSILRQLSFVSPGSTALKPSAEAAYKNKEQEAREHGSQMVEQLTWSECINVLAELLEGHTTVIIIDAFDELKREERGYLFEVFDRLLKSIRQGCLRVFVSSRDDGDIYMYLSKYANIYISAADNKHDIHRFVTVEVEKAISSHRLLRGNVPQDLKYEIIAVLIAGAQGMFRWVSLQIQALCGPHIRTIEAARDILRRMPKTLEDSYDIVYRQILELGPSSSGIASMAIKWMLCSRRLLSTADLLGALSDPAKLQPYPKPQILSADELLDICCNLIVRDEALDTFRFAHLSVREFFETKSEYSARECHEMALDRSLTLLMAEKPTISRHWSPFRSYAIVQWPMHCSAFGDQGPSAQGRQRVEAFLFHNEERSTFYVQWILDLAVMIDSGSFKEPISQSLKDLSLAPMNAIFLVSTYGLSWLLTTMFQFEDFDPYDLKADEDYALHKASKYGHMQAVNKLLNWFPGANTHQLNLAGKEGRTPLHYATINRHSQLALMLLKRGANPAAVDKHLSTPFHEAVKWDHGPLINLMLTYGVDVEARTSNGETPLQVAVEADNAEAVRILLERGADISVKDKNGNDLLQHGSIRTMRLLFTSGMRGFDPKVLIAATKNNRVEVVRFLLENNVPYNTLDNFGRNSLDYALIYGLPSVIELLLRTNIVPSTDWMYESWHITKWKYERWFNSLVQRLNPNPGPREGRPTYGYQLVPVGGQTAVVPMYKRKIEDAGDRNTPGVEEGQRSVMWTGFEGMYNGSQDVLLIHMIIPSDVLGVDAVKFQIAAAMGRSVAGTVDTPSDRASLEIGTASSRSGVKPRLCLKKYSSFNSTLFMHSIGYNDNEWEEICWDRYHQDPEVREWVENLRAGDTIQVFGRVGAYGVQLKAKMIGIKLVDVPTELWAGP